MEESWLQGKTLYCCFVNFKKAFDTMPRSEFLEKNDKPFEYRAIVAQLWSS